MPVFAKQILHGNARTLGVLMGATGVGALCGGALVLASRTNLKGLGRLVMITGISFGISLILFSLSRWYLLSAILMLPVGFSLMVQMASSNTLIQTMVPDRLRGRTMAVYSMMFMGMAPIGALISGALADHLGAPWTVTLGGIGAVIAAAIFGLNLPKFRAEARALINAQGMHGSELQRRLSIRRATLNPGSGAPLHVRGFPSAPFCYTARAIPALP